MSPSKVVTYFLKHTHTHTIILSHTNFNKLINAYTHIYIYHWSVGWYMDLWIIDNTNNLKLPLFFLFSTVLIYLCVSGLMVTVQSSWTTTPLTLMIDYHWPHLCAIHQQLIKLLLAIYNLLSLSLSWVQLACFTISLSVCLSVSHSLPMPAVR